METSYGIWVNKTQKETVWNPCPQGPELGYLSLAAEFTRDSTS